ncbi:hypothetical protein MMC34_000550 [Xylographa carneopallida]|nr:hypothetical protein [Xylographa carneopallida]
MSEEACCTCASLLSKISPQYDTKTEKPVAQDRRLQCCGRVICGRCIADNSRFATYCPFCQVSTVPSLIPQGLRDPPAYSAPPSPRSSLATLAHPPDSGAPPSYASLLHTVPHFEDSKTASDSSSAIDVLHFLSPDDTLQSLSLAYSTPIPVLRSINNLFADHLLAARRTILIPGQYYKGGVSLSPRPVEGEEEELRRSKVRKWMVGCKVAEYNIALLYLQQTNYDLEAAIAAYKADEKWEREHPMNSNVKGKQAQGPGKRRIGGFGISAQLN